MLFVYQQVWFFIVEVEFLWKVCWNVDNFMVDQVFELDEVICYCNIYYYVVEQLDVGFFV